MFTYRTANLTPPLGGTHATCSRLRKWCVMRGAHGNMRSCVKTDIKRSSPIFLLNNKYLTFVDGTQQFGRDLEELL